MSELCGWCGFPDHAEGVHCPRCTIMGGDGLMGCDCGVGCDLGPDACEIRSCCCRSLGETA